MNLQELEYLDSLLLKYGHRVYSYYSKKDSVPEDAIYIGRGSIFGNPYKTGDRIRNCINYHNFIFNLIKNQPNHLLLNHISNLTDKSVICYCNDGQTSRIDGGQHCHGLILLSACDYYNTLLNSTI